MPYNRPTLTELYNLAAGDVLASLGVGDTLLEGVKFEIRPDGDRFTAEAKAEHAKYMKDLSAAWPARVAKAVESEDTLECPQCGGDIDGPAAG